jgi:DNA-binding NarL/FixJ family response regulator
MKTKTIVRQSKIIELLEEGKNLYEISEACNVNEKNYSQRSEKTCRRFS